MVRREEELQIVEEILEGDRDQYRTLVDRYAPMIFSIVNEFVDAESDAEELAQEIFVKTYERLPSFNGQSKFSSWLYMIAKNHCRDYAKNIRRKNKRLGDLSENELDRQLEHSESPDQEVERKEWIEVLKEGLKSINPDYAEAFLMKYDDDMSYKVMSKRLDVSVSALKVRVYRAKKELRTFFESQS